MFGPGGAALGTKLGAGISTVTGFGDYEVATNSLMGSNAVPIFKKNARSIRIAHKEFLGDVTGSLAFAVQAWSLNPGLIENFPWIAQVATAYQQYQFHGCLFEFVSTSANALNSTNTALGTVIMGTQYNVNRSNFTSKVEMEAYEFSSSGRPSANMLHAIECDPSETPIKQMYIRSGALAASEDKRFYDLGTFQLATVGMQAASTIGELWVTYDIEFFKPRVAPSAGPSAGYFAKFSLGPYTNTNSLGSIQTARIGQLPISIVANGAGWDSIQFDPSISSGKFLITVRWTGSVAVVVAGTASTTNLTAPAVGEFGLGGTSAFFTPDAGPTVAQWQYTRITTITGYNAAGSRLIFSAMTLPTTAVAVDVLVMQIPSDYNYA